MRWATAPLRVISRQGIQYHFVPKGDLHSLLATLNHHLVTALGACGDVVRNITCYPAPLADRPRADVGAYAQETARRFRPRTQAYYQLWLDGERAVTAEAPGEEPLYGTTYLPPKFKIGFAFPGDNCIDVYSNDQQDPHDPEPTAGSSPTGPGISADAPQGTPPPDGGRPRGPAPSVHGQRQTPGSDHPRAVAPPAAPTRC
jgi:hypothetical protein